MVWNVVLMKQWEKRVDSESIECLVWMCLSRQIPNPTTSVFLGEGENWGHERKVPLACEKLWGRAQLIPNGTKTSKVDEVSGVPDDQLISQSEFECVSVMCMWELQKEWQIQISQPLSRFDTQIRGNFQEEVSQGEASKLAICSRRFPKCIECV